MVAAVPAPAHHSAAPARSARIAASQAVAAASQSMVRMPVVVSSAAQPGPATAAGAAQVAAALADGASSDSSTGSLLLRTAKVAQAASKAATAVKQPVRSS